MESCHRMAVKQHKEKVLFLKDNGMCFACLIKGHMSNACKKRLTCQICKKRHPTILHIQQVQVPLGRPSMHQSNRNGQAKHSTVPTASSSNPVAIAMSTKHTGAGVSDCKLAIVPVKIKWEIIHSQGDCCQDPFRMDHQWPVECWFTYR